MDDQESKISIMKAEEIKFKNHFTDNEIVWCDIVHSGVVIGLHAQKKTAVDYMFENGFPIESIPIESILEPIKEWYQTKAPAYYALFGDRFSECEDDSFVNVIFDGQEGLERLLLFIKQQLES